MWSNCCRIWYKSIGQPSIPVPVLHANYDVLPSVNIRNTSNDSVGAVMKLSNARGNNAGVNNDTAGELRFLANDDANNLQSFGKIKVTATDVTNESETGKMTLGVSSSDTGGIDDIIQIQGGASAVTSQTAIAGVTTVGSTLTVDGATAIKSTLSVTGATNITSTLDVTGQIKSGRFGANSSITEPGVILNMAGGLTFVILLDDGSAYTGSNFDVNSTELYFPTTYSNTLAEIDSSFTTHYKIPDLTGITFVGGNMWMTGVIANGKMYTWGKETRGAGGLGHGTAYPTNQGTSIPTEVVGITNAVSFSKPRDKEQCFVLLDDGKIMSWGVGENNYPDSETPVELDSSHYNWAGGERATFILGPGRYGTLWILLSDGRVRVTSGHPYESGHYGASSNPYIGNIDNGGAAIDNVIQIDFQSYQFAGVLLTSDGSVFSWGDHQGWNLGRPSVGTNYGDGWDGGAGQVEGIGPGSGAIKIACFTHGTFILFADGSVKAWGQDNTTDRKLLKTGERNNPSVVTVTGLPPLKDIFVPYFVSDQGTDVVIGITKDNSDIIAWGTNQRGTIDRWHPGTISGNYVTIDKSELLKTLDATLTMSVPTSGTTGIVMDIRKDDGSKLFNINESGDTTIAGNLKFDGDMDLDASGTETINAEVNNPNFSVANGELKTFSSDPNLQSIYQSMAQDSDGRICSSLQKFRRISNKIYRVTDDRQLVEIFESTVQIRDMAIDGNHTMYVSGGSGLIIQKITLSNGTVTASDPNFSTGWPIDLGSIVIGPTGKLYAHTMSNDANYYGEIYKVNTTTGVKTLYATLPDTDTSLSFGMAFDSKGDLYVSIHAN